MTNSKKIQLRKSLGLTLIELLIVITILSVVTAMAIPQLRIINRDRGIREAARSVGSTFAKAVSRANSDGDGVAGILIERSPNVVDIDDATHVGGVNYAGTRLFVTRSVPPFSGDDLGSQALVDATNSTILRIPLPIEHTDTNSLINPGDHIRLGYGQTRYRITDVQRFPAANANYPAGPHLQLSIILGTSFDILPAPAVGTNQPYVIYRRPQKLESSQVDLPAGYMIDLRFSGPILSEATLPLPSGVGPIDEFSNQSAFGQKSVENVEILFDETGQINSYNFNFEADDGLFYNSIGNVPFGTIHFFVTEYDPETSNIAPAELLDSMGNPLPTVEDPNLALFDPNAMWVSVDQRTGAVNIAYNAPPLNDVNFIYDKIKGARLFASGKQSATQ